LTLGTPARISTTTLAREASATSRWQLELPIRDTFSAFYHHVDDAMIRTPASTFPPTRTRRQSSVPVILLLLLLADPARASFHFARINQVVTSIGGDATIQFVEIVMIAGGQNLVEDTVLTAFDIDGQYIQDVLVVPSNVADGTAGIAAKAEDGPGVLRATSNTLKACTGCHAAYRQDVVTAETWQKRTGSDHDPSVMRDMR
jgi:hypothetical protein